MDHNPFISRNNDLFMMLIAGISIHFVSAYLLPLSVQTQFVIILIFATFSGLMMSYFSQCVEWALLFMAGLQVVTVIPYLLYFMKHQQLDILGMLNHGYHIGYYGLFLLSSWIIGIPLGFMSKKLLMNNYYRKRRSY